MTERRFDDTEVSLILAHALDTGVPAEDDGGGLTLAELERIAVEVGIDPARIQATARALATGVLGPAPTGRSTTLTPRYEVTLERRITEDRYAELLATIRDAMGRQGIATSEYGALEWRARDAIGGRYVSIRTQGEATRIRAFANLRDGAFLSAAGGGAAGALLTFAALGATGALAAIGAVAIPLVAAGACVPAWWIWRRWFRLEDAALRRTVTELMERVGGAPAVDVRKLEEGRSTNRGAPDPARDPPRAGSSPAAARPPRR